MKYLFSAIMLSASFFGFSQGNMVQVQDYIAPIYPGCEKITESKDQLLCFQQNVVQSYTPYLNNFMEYFEYLNISDARATISFKLDQDGQIELRNIESNSSFFRVYNVLSFANFMVNENKNKHIIPAKSLDGGKSLSMNLSFPVDFKTFKEFPETKDRVIGILNDHEVKYELRLSPSKDIKIYEVNDQRSFYLGKYNTLEEIASTLPYKNLINYESEFTDLGSFSDEKGEYLIRVKNIFARDEFSNEFIVYKVKSKTSRVLTKFNSFEKFMNSPYYQFIVKN